MYNTTKFKAMLQFKGGMPSILFMDVSKGRLAAYRNGEFLGTVLPSGEFFDGGPDDCEWLSADCCVQHRGTYGDIAAFLSAWQQTGSQDEAEDALFASCDAREALGL